MLQPVGRDMTRLPDSVIGGQISGVINSALFGMTDIRRVAKRPLNGLTAGQEPAIKQEKLDRGYERAALNQTGTLLGTIAPTSSVRMPYPIPVQSTAGLRNIQPSNRRGRQRRSRNARLTKCVNVVRGNSHNNTVHHRPVVLLPRGAVVPRQDSFPAVFPHHPMVVPQAVQMYRGGPTTVSAPASSNAPVIVFVSQPSATRATVGRTGLTCTLTPSSLAPFRYPVTHFSLPTQQNNVQLGLDKLARLKAMIGKSVLDKYVGPHEPPSDLHMPVCSKLVCQSCGDEFVTDVGLADHMSRRSMQISFSCSCKLSKWPQLFYNPCMFESFYRSHRDQPGPHASRDSVVISTLDLDTPEYRSCLEAWNQKVDAAATRSAVSQSSENMNNQQHVTTTADSNSDSRQVAAVAPVKEIYVNVEVVPNKQGNKQVVQSGQVDKDTSSTVLTKTNKTRLYEPASTANSGLARVMDFSGAIFRNRTKCPECSVDYKTRHKLLAHFSVSTKQRLCCTDCGLMLPGCSFSAHRRLHENRPPFVCPRCGIVFDEAESVAVFRAHVERCCFHLMQSSSGVFTSNCPRCSFHLSEADERKMAEHIVNAHAIIYYKCRLCPKAFVNDSAAKRHSENTGHDAQKDIVRKCPLCDAVFKGDTGVEMQTHVTEHQNIPLFHCPVCLLPVSQSAVVEHMRSCHLDKILPATTCEVCGQPSANIEELFTHVSTKHLGYFQSVMKCLPSAVDKKSTSDMEGESNAQNESISNTSTASIAEPASVSESEVQTSTSSTKVFECARCQTKFTSEDIYKRHQAKHRFLESKKASKKHAVAKPSSDPLEQVPVPKDKRCTRCSQTFDNAESLNQHINMLHGSPGCHLCHLCADGFSTSRQLERHVEIQHCGKTETSHRYFCALCAESPENGPVSYAVQGLLTKHLQNAHGVPRTAAANMARAAAPPVPTSDPENHTEQVQDSPSCSSSETKPIKRLFVSGETTVYQCSRCDFSVEDRSSFVKHAAEHRPTVAGAVQCKECAASFTVAVALHRHLRVIHRIDGDIETYLRENRGAARCPTPDSSYTDDDLGSPAHLSNSSSLSLSGGRSTESTGNVRKLPMSAKGNDDDDAPAECTVCYRVFLSKQLLRAHLRTHGIAFIQHTRRKLAATSPTAGSPPT